MSRGPQVNDSFSFASRRAKQRWITVAAQAPGLDYPQQNRLTRAELLPDAFTTSAPEHLLSPTADQAPPQNLREDNAHREIQPDDRIRLRPDDVTDDCVATID